MRRIMIIVVMLGILFALIGFGVSRRNDGIPEIERTVAGESDELLPSLGSSTSTETSTLN